MEKVRSVILVDAKNLAYRVHYTRQQLSSRGRPTSILHGFLLMLASISRKKPDTPIVVVWDGDGKTWRHRLLEERRLRMRVDPAKGVSKIRAQKDSQRRYKGNRGMSAKDAMHKQFPTLLKMLDVIGIHHVVVDNLEADDLIGILTTFLLDKLSFDKVYIYSRDKDFFQLASNRIKIWSPESGEKKPTIMTRDRILKKYNVSHKDWSKFRALSGDPSDNIPNIKFKVGPKTSMALMAQGLDPSKKLFKQLSKLAQRNDKIKEFESIWQDVYGNYQLCQILRKADSKLLSVETCRQIGRVLHRCRTKGVGRDKRKQRQSENLQKFLEMLLDFELMEVWQNRHNIWSIP